MVRFRVRGMVWVTWSELEDAATWPPLTLTGSLSLGFGTGSLSRLGLVLILGFIRGRVGVRFTISVVVRAARRF